MSVTFPLAFPIATGLVDIAIYGRQLSGVTEAPFSGVEQVQEHQLARWRAEFSLPPMTRQEAMPWRSFIQKMRGRVGTFLMGDPMGTAPLGTAAVTPGTPQVDGGGQSGLTLAVKTGLGSVSGYLLEGTWLSLGTGSGRQLYTVTNDVNLVNGNATIDIWPRLRSSPGNNDTVYLTNTTGLFRLVDDEHGFSIGRDGLYRIPPVSCREALNP